MKSINAAVIQAGSKLFDTPATLEKFADLAADAAARGARLAVFPEAFIGGYPKGADFGARIGSRSAEGRELFRRYFDSAIRLDGPEAAMICETAKANMLDIVVGIIERASPEEGAATLYCTALYVAKSGEIVGKRRKVMPTAMERLIWGFGDGSTLDAWESEYGKIGAAICWENYMPALRLALYGQGVELYCAPTVDDRESWATTMRTVALEGRCFVLSACQYMTRADAPADFAPIQGDDPQAVLINGGSVIVSPLGDVLAGPVYGEEAVLTADLDAGDIARGKFDFDVSGHYARPDIFSLHVDRRRKHPLSDE
ncbi:MAG: carbon-nitrogen hydrolase family protein [Parvularculaceae bacterium]